MSTSSDHETIEELASRILTVGENRERRRIVGVLLNAYGRYKLAGHADVAEALDELVTQIESHQS